jgi:hypothetical protein
VAGAGIGRVRRKGLDGGQGLRLQQAPEAIVGIVFAHVGCCGEQEQVMGAPRELPAGIVGGDAGHALGEAVAIGAAQREVGLAVGGEFVALVERVCGSRRR